MTTEIREQDRCYWCRRDTMDYPSVNVSLSDGRVVACCWVCYERGDEGIEVPLDYTEDEA